VIHFAGVDVTQVAACGVVEDGKQSGGVPEMMLQRAKKKPFKIDLAEMHAVCDANYARLLRLFPDYENANTRNFFVGDAKVKLEVIERCRYTTIFHLHQHHAHDAWLGRLRVEVRAYHDAGMLEVGMFQSHRSIAARYHYPNDRMYQQDEKSQQNRFLADWLEHCLHNGRACLEPGHAGGLS
jgi:uncharacterized protein YqiB (DUF1249 family)